MRIHLITPGGLSRPGEHADIPVLCELTARLAREHDVTAILLRQYPGPCEYSRFGARIINLGAVPRGLGRVATWWRGRRLAALLGDAPAPDIVHAFWIGPSSDLAFSHPTAGGAKRLVTTMGGELIALDDIGYGGMRTRQGRAAAARSFARADAVVALCEESLERVPATVKRRVLLPLYPDIAPHRRAPASPPGEPGHVLTVSNINRIKDPETMLRAFAYVAGRVPGARFTWCGIDTLNGSAQRRAGELGIADRVFFAGAQIYEALPARYHAAQVYLQASRNEGQGVAVCEAAAAGLAIVGTDTGILRALAAAGGALAAPVGDHEALGEALVRALTDAELRGQLGEKAAAWATTRTADHTAQAVESLYEELLAEAGI